MNGPRSEQKGRSRSTARQQGEEAGGDHSGGSQSMTARGKPQAANDWVSGGYSCLPSCGFDMARALGGKRQEEAGAKWGAASGHDGRVILLSCCQRRCPCFFLPSRRSRRDRLEFGRRTRGLPTGRPGRGVVQSPTRVAVGPGPGANGRLHLRLPNAAGGR